MARYLDPTGTKFWEIERAGATVTRKSGKLGSKGRTQTTTFDNALLARWHHGNFVGYKTHTERYVRDALDTEPPPAAVFDDDEWLVHADALQGKGEPLGELIALQHAVETTGESPKLASAIDELARAHGAALYGDLACARELVQLTWRRGRVRGARVDHDRETTTKWFETIERVLPKVPACYRLGTVLAALLELPIARVLEELAIGNVGTTDYQHTMLCIVDHAPPTLRRLAIRGDVRRLRSEAFVAALRFPALEVLDCDLYLSEQALQHVTTASCPRLRHLAFRVFDPDLACRMLLDTPLVDQLASLVIRTSRPVDPALAAALRQRAPFVELDAS